MTDKIKKKEDCTLSERCIIINDGMVVFDGSAKEIFRDARFLRSNNLDLPLRFLS